MMNPPVKDPRSLTKERLKSELSDRNISLPPSDSKKDVYVDLYREHILAPSTSSSSKFPGEVDRKAASLDAFSSDEEETESSVVPKKTRMTNGETDPISADEVDGLTDDDLFMALVRRGETVGPIVDSTRRVYQKKLKRILTEESEATVDYSNGHRTEDNGHDEEFSDQEEVEEPMETEIIPPYKEPVPEPPRPQRQREPTKAASELRPTTFVTRHEPVLRPAVAREQRVLPPSDDRPTITHRSVHRSFRTRTDDGKTSREEEIVSHADEVSEQTLASIDTHHKQLQKRQGLSVWLQLFIIAVCAVVVFLVLSNMEPAYENPAVGELDGATAV